MAATDGSAVVGSCLGFYVGYLSSIHRPYNALENKQVRKSRRARLSRLVAGPAHSLSIFLLSTPPPALKKGYVCEWGQ